MRSLLIYLKNYRKETILAPLFKMLEASFELLVPLVMAAVIDIGISQKDGAYIIRMCLVLIVLGIVGLICSLTAQYFSAKAAAGFGTGLRHALFEHIQHFGFLEMDEIGSSTLVTRMTSDVNQAQAGVNLVLRLFLRSPFIVFGAMVMALMVDVKAAMVFAIVIPLLSVVVFGIMLITMPLYKKVQSYLDEILLKTRENLIGVRVLRAFNKEEKEKAEFEENNQKLTKEQKFVGSISGLMNPLTYIIVNVGIIVLIYVGAVRVNMGSLTQGEVVALVNYMSQILVELVKLANLIITVTKAAACGKRIEAVLAVKPKMKSGSFLYVKEKENAPEEKTILKEKNAPKEKNVLNGKCIPAVEFSDVSLTYKNAGAPSLSDISFRAMPGETIGIIGGTGAGKSSVVNMIPRFYDASEGEVKVFGHDVREYEIESLRSHIGVVPQKAALFKGTVAENLRWGDENASEEILEEALEISQAKEFIDSKPGRLEFMIEQNGRNLSGGQRQRLTIARALVRKPDILILDDSASALDFATDAALRYAIKNMKENPTVFLVSQRAASVRYADRIVVLEDGKAAAIGTHEELMRNSPAYQEIYYSQFPEEAVLHV